MSFDGGARRTEILETAAHLFASSGLKTSLKEIADACGILPGSLYHHFDSKESIIVELIEQYRNDLDAIAEQARVRLRDEPEVPIADEITRLGRQIVACALRHRAALLLTFYEPPSGAGDELVRVARRTPEAIEAAALETFRVGRSQGYLRDGVDLELLADRFCQVMLHVGLGAFADLSGVEQLAEIRCRILFEGIATRPPDDAGLDRSAAMAAARDVLASWESTEKDEDERLTTLRAIARTEFGRKGYEATTVRDIASAAGLSTGSVYRLVGSKDELLATIMRSFVTRVRRAGGRCSAPGPPRWRSSTP
ncbi:MAG: TetR/AcrR family transcriptional regulator [Acidimicrobiales bacterium]